MKAFVIAIDGHEKSQAAADRCILSGKRNGIEVEKWSAYTPDHDPITLAGHMGIDTRRFDEIYSRQDNCIAAFLSHHSLWKECVELNEPIAIFEHDAVIHDMLPIVNVEGVINIGQPSYGKYKQPSHLGIGPLTTKEYFPGAHAYIVTPRAAIGLIGSAKANARPTDVFLHNNLFTFLYEHYPFIARADDSFTTIQVERGCVAKHNYNANYEVSNV